MVWFSSQVHYYLGNLSCQIPELHSPQEILSQSEIKVHEVLLVVALLQFERDYKRWCQRLFFCARLLNCSAGLNGFDLEASKDHLLKFFFVFIFLFLSSFVFL